MVIKLSKQLPGKPYQWPEKPTTKTIYVSICRPTGQMYVGGTHLPLWSRWAAHGNDNPNTKIGAAISQYGLSSFELRILEESVSFADADERERYWVAELDTFNNGLNSTSGGVRGTRMSKEHGEKSRRAMKKLHREGWFKQRSSSSKSIGQG